METQASENHHGGQGCRGNIRLTGVEVQNGILQM